MFNFDIARERPITEQLKKVSDQESLIFSETQRPLNPSKIEDAWFTYGHTNHEEQPDYPKKIRKIQKKDNSKNRSNSKRYRKRCKPSIPAFEKKPQRAKKEPKPSNLVDKKAPKYKKIKGYNEKKNFDQSRPNVKNFTKSSSLHQLHPSHSNNQDILSKMDKRRKASQKIEKPVRSRTLESRRKEYKDKKKGNKLLLKKRSISSKNIHFLYEPTMFSRRELKELEAAIGISWYHMAVDQRKEINDFIKNR